MRINRCLAAVRLNGWIMRDKQEYKPSCGVPSRRFQHRSRYPLMRRGALVVCALALGAWPQAQAQADSGLLLQPVVYAPQKNSSSPAATDSCLPLLKSIHNPSSASAGSQRSAGKVAALGLILGVRSALSPPQNTHKARTGAISQRLVSIKRQSDQASPIENRSALSVFAYRQCRKEQALADARRALF